MPSRLPCWTPSARASRATRHPCWHGRITGVRHRHPRRALLPKAILRSSLDCDRRDSTESGRCPIRASGAIASTIASRAARRAERVARRASACRPSATGDARHGDSRRLRCLPGFAGVPSYRRPFRQARLPNGGASVRIFPWARLALISFFTFPRQRRSGGTSASSMIPQETASPLAVFYWGAESESR